VLDVAQSAQGLGLVLTIQISPPNSRILHLRLGFTKRCWGEIKRLSKGYENGQEPATHESGGGVPFIENLEN
jgi:hypothetical protein